jgi:hypothetical protein
MFRGLTDENDKLSFDVGRKKRGNNHIFITFASEWFIWLKEMNTWFANYDSWYPGRMGIYTSWWLKNLPGLHILESVLNFYAFFFFFDSLLEFVKNKYGCKQAEPSEAECLLLWPLLGQIKWAWAQLGDIKVPSRYLLMIFKDDVLLGTGQIPKTNWYFVFVHYISHHSMTFPTTPLNSQAFMLDWSCSH